MIDDRLNNQIDREVSDLDNDGPTGVGGTGGTIPSSPPSNGNDVPTYNGGQVRIKATGDWPNLRIVEGNSNEIGTTPVVFNRTFESLLNQGQRYRVISETRRPLFYYNVKTFWETVERRAGRQDIPTVGSDGEMRLQESTPGPIEDIEVDDLTFTIRLPRILVEKFDLNGQRINTTTHQVDDLIVDLNFETEEIEVIEEDPEYSIFVQSITRDDRITDTDRDREDLVNFIFGEQIEGLSVEELPGGEGTFISNIPSTNTEELKFSISDDDFRVTSIKIYNNTGDRDYSRGSLINELTDEREFSLTSIDNNLIIEFEYELAQRLENEVTVPEVSLSTPTLTYDVSTDDDILFSVTKSNATGVRVVDWKNNEYTFEFGNSNFKIIRIPREVVVDTGQRTISIIPFDENGDGIPKQQVVNIVDEGGILTARFSRINYPSVISGNDFQGFNVNFNINYTTSNADYIEAYVGPENKWYGTFAANTNITFNVQRLINNFRIGAGTEQELQFEIRLVPINNIGEGQTETLRIAFNKSRVQLPTEFVESNLEEAILDDIDLDDIDIEDTKYLSHIVNIEGQDFNVIANWDRDDVTFTEFEEDELGNEIPVDGVVNSSLVLKLFEPLPRSIQPNTQLWISKLKATPFIDRVTLREETEDACVRLRPPNFDVSPTRGSMDYEMFDEIIGAGSVTSEDLVRQFVKQRGLNDVKLDITFIDEDTLTLNFEHFIHFSSAEAQLLNYDFKIKQLNAYADRLDELQSITAPSIAQTHEEERIRDNIDTLIGNFTGLERSLYDILQLQDSTDSSYTQTLDSLIVDAIEYDKNNENSLTYNSNLPRHILNDSQNESFMLFLEMIGQHFDVLWSYINGVKQTNIIEHKKDDGIIDDLVYHMLESFGWDVESTAATQQLWQSAFGQTRDRELIPGTDGDNELFADGNTYQSQIWRRILNNLPYLLKQKGTRRSLSAILSIYGVPNSLLSIVEFGGPVDDDHENLTVTIEDKTNALHIPNESAYIQIGWLQNSSFDQTFDFTFGDYPSSFELRFLPTAIKQSTLLEADEWNLQLIPTTGVNGRLRFEIGTGSIETDEFPFFDDEYSQVLLTKGEPSGSMVDYTISAAEGFQERIRAQVTESFTVQDTAEWGQGAYIRMFETFIGNVDEFRLWRSPLNEESFLNHALSPDSIDGNELRSSTDDLLIRYDFEVPKNRHASGDPTLKNVAPSFTYQANGLTIAFPDEPDYPFSHIVYNRDVTAKVPSIGFNFANKTRLEDIELIAPLSHKERSTIKAFDRAPIDSNRLGLFLSPIKEVNLDIIKKFGSKFRIDDFIGDPADEFRSEYKSLKELREYYFEFIDLNIYEYVQLVQYIDRTLFDVLEKMIPARVKLSKGLLFENHILTRSKVDWTKPTGSDDTKEAKIDVVDDIEPIAELKILNAIIDEADAEELSVEDLSFEGLIDESDIEELEFEFSDLIGLIEDPLDEDLQASFETFEALISADFGATVTGFAESFGIFTIVGTNDTENPSVIGFGFFGEPSSPGFVIRNRLTRDGALIKERLYVEVITERRVVKTPSRNALVSGSSGIERIDTIVDIEKFDTKVNVRPAFVQSGPQSGSLQSPTPIQDNVVDVRPLIGYLPSHFRFTGDQTTGLQRSFFKGSKNTSDTTIDGAPAVETFSTNPNTLRVTEAGRGSGEPILRVDGDDE